MYYTLSSGIWVGPTLLFSRWNIPAYHTGEIHKKYTMPTRHIESDFQVSFDSTCTHMPKFTLKIFLYFLTNSNYTIILTCTRTCSRLFYFKEQYYNSLKTVGIKQIKKLHAFTTSNCQYREQGREGGTLFRS